MMQPHLKMQYVMVLGFLITAVMGVSAADDANEDAIKKDRKRIEGTWTIVSLVVNGNSSTVDSGKMIVVNGADGSWNLTVDGQEIVQGTTTIDPSKKPKTIDIKPTTGDDKGKIYQGIYEVGDDTRKLCFAPTGKPRPTEFTSATGSDNVLVIFERLKK